MGKSRILVQLDPDPHPSVFDAVVAIDAPVDHLLQYAGVTVEQVEALVHGTIFTRGPADLKSTAIFVGGTQVDAGQQILARIKKTFFGPMRVSVMLDPNGANTTAAAAVLAACRHVPLEGASALVLGGTGPVGQRAARLMAGQGTNVRVASRSYDRANHVCQSLSEQVAGSATLEPIEANSLETTRAALEGVQIVIAAGAAGVELLPTTLRDEASSLRVAIDLNAVPPAGIGGIGVMDLARDDGGVLLYGAIGVGGTKMKIHKAALNQLFETNDLVLDAEEIFALGKSLESGTA